MLGYDLDATDRLVAIEGPWDDFASANGCPELTRDRVLGTSLFDHVAGDEVSEVLGLLLQRARAGRSIDLAFRCDSPSRRRWLRLQIRGAGPSGVLRCATELEREEPRAALSLLDRAASRSAELLRICSWCRKVQVGDGWREAEDAIAALGLFEGAGLPQLTHGICPACRLLLRQE